VHTIRPQRIAERGFALVEALIAMTALFLAIIAMLSVIPFGFSSVQSNSVRAQAVTVGQLSLDDQRNAVMHGLPAPTATTVPVDPGESYVNSGVSNTNYGNFTVTPNGCATVQTTGTALSQVNLYLCSVTVTWKISIFPKSITEQSYVVASKS
jgi:Tfp pilus assembly protein PilV